MESGPALILRTLDKHLTAMVPEVLSEIFSVSSKKLRVLLDSPRA